MMSFAIRVYRTYGLSTYNDKHSCKVHTRGLHALENKGRITSLTIY